MNKRMLFVLASAVLIILGIYFRYQNGQSARESAAALQQHDLISNPSPDGQVGPSESQKLKDYVNAHMGASVTYTLTGSYQRAQAAAQTAASAQAANGQIYADAQRACSGKTDSITQAKCNADYLAKHPPTAPAASPVVAPKLSDYQVSLRSPLWTPDLAGALLLGGVAALVLGAFSYRRNL